MPESSGPRCRRSCDIRVRSSGEPAPMKPQTPHIEIERSQPYDGSLAVAGASDEAAGTSGSMPPLMVDTA